MNFIELVGGGILKGTDQSPPPSSQIPLRGTASPPALSAGLHKSCPAAKAPDEQGQPKAVCEANADREERRFWYFSCRKVHITTLIIWKRYIISHVEITPLDSRLMQISCPVSFGESLLALELSSQVQHFIKKDFKRRSPTKAFARTQV